MQGPRTTGQSHLIFRKNSTISRQWLPHEAASIILPERRRFSGLGVKLVRTVARNLQCNLGAGDVNEVLQELASKEFIESRWEQQLPCSISIKTRHTDVPDALAAAATAA